MSLRSTKQKAMVIKVAFMSTDGALFIIGSKASLLIIINKHSAEKAISLIHVMDIVVKLLAPLSSLRHSTV